MPASLMMKASSGPVSRKLSGTKMAPSRAEANSVSKNAGWLSPRKATRSPWHTPPSCRSAARESMRSSISA